MIKILIVDDHSIVREGLRAVFGLETDLMVIGEAVNGLDAIEKATALNPDVIIMDLIMPTVDGLEAIQRILENHPEMRILILTSSVEIKNVLPTVRSGAMGYILKNSDPEELIKGIHEVMNGAIYIQAEIAKQLHKAINQSAEETLIQPVNLLSEREIEILCLVAEGLSNEEIAEKLIISTRTVGAHISHVLAKLGLTNRTQAALFALRTKIVKLFPD